jgi:hypothetical protein
MSDPTPATQPLVRVTSEIGRLRTVICHTPGPELLAVTPSNREQYLYDDIIDLEQARREHQRFRAILSRFAEVLDVRDLLADIVDQDGGAALPHRPGDGGGPLRAPGRASSWRCRARAGPALHRGEGGPRGPHLPAPAQGQLRAAAAPQPLLHPRRGDGGERGGDHRRHALRRAVDGGAADEGALPVPPAPGERAASSTTAPRSTAATTPSRGATSWCCARTWRWWGSRSGAARRPSRGWWRGSRRRRGWRTCWWSSSPPTARPSTWT